MFHYAQFPRTTIGPILRKQTSVYPEDLFDDLGNAASERAWWVLYTKARQEKSLARDLVSQQIPFYLPLVKKTVMLRGRKSDSFLPLFSGYVLSLIHI